MAHLASPVIMACSTRHSANHSPPRTRAIAHKQTRSVEIYAVSELSQLPLIYSNLPVQSINSMAGSSKTGLTSFSPPPSLTPSERTRVPFPERSSGYPDFSFPWFCKITPGKCWDGSLMKAMADAFPFLPQSLIPVQLSLSLTTSLLTRPASSSTMPTYKHLGMTQPGIEPGSPWSSPVCPALPFRRSFIITSVTLISSQDLAFKLPFYTLLTMRKQHYKVNNDSAQQPINWHDVVFCGEGRHRGVRSPACVWPAIILRYGMVAGLALGIKAMNYPSLQISSHHLLGGGVPTNGEGVCVPAHTFCSIGSHSGGVVVYITHLPPRQTEFDSLQGHPQILAYGNCAR
ncbi:hypothetical protein PR048_012837 [Dryococelus australis]|uniref:Uncharacterized protein n=1 Tax=Dryococelus australis TaxID=614101 RepID=A0ABQ9HQR8_9NEOP|nr:hypothetical protein PR048_012837 [Dryococelus australis]